MNPRLLEFFNDHYVPGGICLVGANDTIGWLIRNGQTGITLDKKPSLWSHAFIYGDRRPDGRTDGNIYIFESDLNINVSNWQVINGVQENRIVKWCEDSVEHACVLGMNLSTNERGSLLNRALELAYDEEHLQYPVGELFGTIGAILFKKLTRKNIFDDKYAVQCSTFVRMCYQHINHEILIGPTDLTHTSPEKIFQSQVFTCRKEWHK